MSCREGRLVAIGLGVPRATQLTAEGHCHVVVIGSAVDRLELTARDSASVEIRTSRVGGNLTALGHARIEVIDSRPAPGQDLVVYADGTARVTVTRSLLRGDHPAGGNANGAVVATDSVLEGHGGETAIYTWGAASVQVLGGTLIGTAVAQDGGELDLHPTRWIAASDDARRTLRALHCLATADLRARAAIEDVRARRPLALGVDEVRACADGASAPIDARRRRPPRTSDALATRWAALLLPFAGKAQQLRDYLAAGDDKDDAGKRGAALRGELARLAGELEASSRVYTAAVVGDRDRARAWLRGVVKHRLQQHIVELVAAAQDVCLGSPAPDAAALDRASEAATKLFDLVATEPKIADDVDTFWAPESGNATTWSALETALRALRDEVKRVRRELADRKRTATLDAALGIAAALDEVDSHYNRLRFGH